MLLVLKNWRNIPARIITNVTDTMIDGDDFCWRIGRSKRFNHRMDLDRLESEYQFAYLMGEETYLYGCQHYIRWLVWNHFLIFDLTEAGAIAHIRKNPVKP